jgi:hypothetical protein
VIYVVAGFGGAAAWPYVKTGVAEEAVFGVERVIAFVFWWLVLPAALIRKVWDTIKAVMEWLFTKS